MKGGLNIKSVTCVIFLIFQICVFMTGAQTKQDLCSVPFNSFYTVSETDPPTTHVLTIPAPTEVRWSMHVSYASLPANINGKLDPYLILQRNSDGDYLLTLNRRLDIEDIYATLGIQLSALAVRLTCSQPGHPDQSQDVFIQVDPVNEYNPEFIGSPFAINVSENEAVGYPVIILDSKTQDLDVRPGTGEIYAYSIEPFDYIRFNGKREDDGREYFVMRDTQKGRIEIAKKLDFEQLDHDNRTTLWLNVTVKDYSGTSNWTTVTITVQDDDDLCPEFYVSSVCVPQPLKYPPCYITYKAKVLVNTTGEVNHIEPGPIFAHDRDTINNSVIYSMPTSLGDPELSTHLHINQKTGVLKVVRPFPTPSVYSLILVAEEVSTLGCTAQATLQLNVYSPTYDPWNTASFSTTPAKTAPADSTKASDGGHDADGRRIDTNLGGGGSGGSDDSSSNDSNEVPLIGMAILGVLVVVLAVALFVTCMKLRKYRLRRVVSLDTSSGSRNSFVKEEELPDSSREVSPHPQKKYQEDPINTFPGDSEGDSKFLVVQPSASDGAPETDVFDGTRAFDLGVADDFFTAPGKIKVPLWRSEVQDSLAKPIIIDDEHMS